MPNHRSCENDAPANPARGNLFSKPKQNQPLAEKLIPAPDKCGRGRCEGWGSGWIESRVLKDIDCYPPIDDAAIVRLVVSMSYLRDLIGLGTEFVNSILQNTLSKIILTHEVVFLILSTRQTS